MTDKLDDVIKDQSDQSYADVKDRYGQVVYERWLNPPQRGALEKPDEYACLTGSCGDTIEIFLRFENDRVKEALFRANGCGVSTACRFVCRRDGPWQNSG